MAGSVESGRMWGSRPNHDYLSAVEKDPRLNRAVDAIVARLKASTDERDVSLLAAMRAADQAWRDTTRADVGFAGPAVQAAVLVERWARVHGDDAPGRDLQAAADWVLATIAAGNRLPANFRAVEFSRVAIYFDAPYPPNVARALARDGVEVDLAEFACQPKAPPYKLLDAVTGKRRRLLAITVDASPYATTAELVALPAGEFLLALDAGSKSSHELPWNPGGWCDAPPGAAIALRHLGPILSHHRVEAMSVLL